MGHRQSAFNDSVTVNGSVKKRGHFLKLGEFFLASSIQLPTDWETFSDYPSFVKKRFMGFLTWANQIDEPESARAKVQAGLELVHGYMWPILEAIQQLFAGQPSDAYSTCAHAFELAKPVLLTRLRAQLASEQLGLLYRVRRHCGKKITREDLFHVPFEHRSKVASQRYSIPGLPCLYLCGSTHTCWAEMGQPPFHELSASAFWLENGKSVTIVNMSERPSTLGFRLNSDADLQDQNDEDYLVAHVLLWPLFFSCSVRVKERGDPFKPEYIIPQLLLQWIAKQEDIDGVCYFSTHVDGISRRDPWLPCNFVFPAKHIRPTGRCLHLRELFRMTAPQSWQLLSSIGAGHGEPAKGPELTKFEFIPDVHVLYGQTEFGRVQRRLSTLATADMEKIRQGAKELGRVSL